jgi:hypothetical protein
MAHGTVNGKPLTTNEHEDYQQQELDDHEQVKQRAEALVRRVGQACDELERLAEENPELVGRVTHGAEEHKEAYLRLKARLALAHATPRCRWVRQDGTTCGSPQMKRHIYCFAHKQMAEAQALALLLPALEDANAIQVGLMRIQKALIDDTISTKKAGLLYSMQLALQNVGQVTFGQAKAEEPVRETVDAEKAFREKAFSNQQSAFSQDQPQNQTFETQRNGGSGGEAGLPLINTDNTDEKSLPLMDADDRGFKGGIRPVEWKPTPDMYRMDTQEGMEAYEASFRMKSALRLGAEERPPIASGDRAGTHNSPLRDERLPKGPRFACEPIDADTGVGSVLRTEPYANLG